MRSGDLSRILVITGLLLMLGGGLVAAGFAVADALDDPGTLSVSASTPSGPPATFVPTPEQPIPTVPPVTAPPVPSLVEVDAAPALDGLRSAAFGGRPFLTRELVLYPGYAILEAQDPAEPAHLERFTWRPDRVDGPDPVRLPGNDFPDEELFDLTEVDFGQVPALAAVAKASFPNVENPEVTHVIIDRFLPFDDRVLFRVYVSDPDRGGGGYLKATADGTVLEAVG